MVVGDKIRLVKPFGVLDTVGAIYDVVAIFKAGEIYFEYGGGHTGVMSYDDFEKHFELVPAEKKKHEWTEWEDTKTIFWDPTKEDGDEEVILEWRTDNEKRVQVRVKDNPQLRSRSSCYKDDEFSKWDGYLLAKYRVYVKWLTKLINDYAKSL